MNHNELTFICHLTPERYLERINDISNAASNYQYKVIKAIKPNKVIAIMPLPCYGHNYIYDNPSPGINFLNGRNLKYGKIVKIVTDYIDCIKTLKSNSINVYYSLNVQTFMLVLYSKYFLSSENYVIIADYESTENYKSILRKALQYFINLMYKIADGVIVLSENIKVHPNTIVFAALVDEDELEKVDTVDIEKKSILFSGSIGKTTGIHVAVKAMDLLQDYHLYITGKFFNFSKIEFENLLKLNQNSSNITYLGNVPKSEYLNLLSKAEFALSLRDVNEIEHQYNFPSKIVEYMSNNKKVISTLRYKSLDDSSYLFTKYLPNDLANVIMTNTEAEQPNLRRYVLNSFGLESFKRAFNLLISK